jgi:hypothetical protein
MFWFSVNWTSVLKKERVLPLKSHLRFAVNGRTLYASCALDTIFLPGLLGETAEVESTCPVTGEAIRLTITPDGVTQYSPAGTVLSIAVPGVSCNREEADGEADRARESCQQMYFFSTRTAAEQWIKDYPGVVILTVEDAWQLAKAHWIDRRRQQQVSVAYTEDQTNGTSDGACC